MGRNKTPPLTDNEHVKELLAILEKNKTPAVKPLLSVLNQVGAMERQLDAAVRELQSMRRELAEAQKQNHPVRHAMQKAVILMQAQVLELRDKLDALKQSVIKGCKNAVAAFKEKGIRGLDNIARFFKTKPILESMRNDLNKGIQVDTKAIATIEAVSTEYHKAGRHMKNMGRALVGAEIIPDAKPPGKLAKAVSTPFRAERACLVAMKKGVEAAIGNLNRLEQRAAERKPSIHKTMETLNKQIAEAQKTAPAKTRQRAAAHADR